jgi:hypothetical protein
MRGLGRSLVGPYNGLLPFEVADRTATRLPFRSNKLLKTTGNVGRDRDRIEGAANPAAAKPNSRLTSAAPIHPKA